MSISDSAAWQAVLDRDRQFDGQFVYAVRSTGVYCRPSCPSRRPRREQVDFYETNEAAAQAGFRPCKRCRPDEVDSQAEMVRQVCAYIETHETATLAELSQAVSVSPFHLQRVFKRLMGISPRQYADAYRLGQLKTHLKKGSSVTDAVYEAGYGSSSRVYERSDGQLGMTPSAYRRGGEGMNIVYTVRDCPLGRVLIAVTERGVCAVSLGSSDAMLDEFVLNEFPAASVRRDDGLLSDWVDAILSYLNGWQPRVDVPLDVQATAFQRRVWEALRTIPAGETRTYSQVAASIGQPTAVRAVAHACATNRIALAIPCHRVIRTDGDLGGYRWGLERKRTLLAQERKQAEPVAVASGE
jgi:AraC family transcriptional regulator, regulatory protein of adaptative response / methylated-DNA-[protein]-cysteine methyltransferase